MLVDLGLPAGSLHAPSVVSKEVGDAEDSQRQAHLASNSLSLEMPLFFELWLNPGGRLRGQSEQVSLVCRYNPAPEHYKPIPQTSFVV